MNNDEKIMCIFFGIPVIITAIAVVANDTGFIPKSACFLIMAGTVFAGILLLPLRNILLRNELSKLREANSGD